MGDRTVSINYKGKSESAEVAARRVAAANVKAAKESEAAFAKSAAAQDARLKSVGSTVSASGSGGLKGIASGLSQIGAEGAVAGAGVVAAVAAVKSLVDAGRDQERAGRITQAVIQSTGGAAGVTSKQVQDLATSLSLVSGVQDETIESGENVLLTFRQVRNEAGEGNDVFTRASKDALDLSAAYGLELPQSMKVLGKALADPLTGMNNLRRAGVILTDQQKKQITAFVKQGDVLSAQKVILKEFETEFGGAAAASADSFSLFNVRIQEAKESLGTALIPELNSYVGAATKGIDATNSLGGAIGKALSHIPGLEGAGKSGGGIGAFGHFVDTTINALVPGGGIITGAKDWLTGKKAVDAVTKAYNDLADAQRKQANDRLNGASQKQLAADADVVAGALKRVDLATRGASTSLDKDAHSAGMTADAYQKLADRADAAAKAASQPIRLQIAVDTAATSFKGAIDALHNPDTGSSKGGSTETAASKFFDQASKRTALRDADLAVSRSSEGVADAQHSLAAAEDAATQASKDAQTAQQNLDVVLDGVTAGSKAAKDAQDAYTSALDKSKSASLDLIDAQRNLKDAKDAAANAGREASENAGSTGRGVQSAQLDVQDARDALARARESEDPETIARAQIALGNAQQSLTDATESNTEAQKQLGEVNKKNSKESEDVKRAQIGLNEAQIAARQAAQDQIEAQRVLNGTLTGFGKKSKEAQQATADLKSAQDNLFTSTQGVISAQNGLVDSQNNVYDSNLALQRATADLQGKLDAVGGGDAGKKLDSYQTRLDNLKGAGQDVADSVYANVKNVTHNTGQAILAEISALEFAVGLEPALAGAYSSELNTLRAGYQKYLDATGASVYTSAGSHPGAGTGHIRRHAAGGSTGSGDSSGFLAVVHPNEYVIQSKAVEKYGTHMMDSINSGKIEAHAAGGPIGRFLPGPSSGGGITINMPVYGNVYADDLERRMQRAAENAARNNPHVTPGRPR